MLINRWQTTLQKAFTFTGKGLHSGRVVSMIVKPAAMHSGIRFMRTDLTAVRATLALASQITNTELSTTIGEGPQAIASIEHLMAAFAGLAIANADVYINGPEVPIMDGSAGDFVRAFLQVGLLEQTAPARAYRLKQAFEIVEGDKWMLFEPADSGLIHCTIDFRTPAIGRQSLVYESNLNSFLDLADARTFCHLADISGMREKGLALGGSLHNAIVVSDEGLLNEQGLRSPDEFVRHKVVDLLGDLNLLGAPLLAKVYAHKSGHSLHAKALQALLAKREHYLEEFFPDTAAAPLARLQGPTIPKAAQYA